MRWITAPARPASLVRWLLFAFFWSSCLIEDSFIYYPEREFIMTPDDVGLPYEVVSTETKDDIHLQSWLVAGDTNKPLIIFFHGNAGNISHRVDRARWILSGIDASVLLAEYRGYGASKGKPSEKGLYTDAQSVYRWALARGWSPERIIAFGESLGCAVTIELAVREKLAAVILESAFLSIGAMARTLFPIPLGAILRTKFDNADKIGRITVPLLITHGDRDDIVPFPHGEQLFALAKGPKQFFRIRNAKHNDTYVVGGPEYLRAVREFVEKTTATRSGR